jgi:hypothetical protein
MNRFLQPWIAAIVGVAAGALSAYGFLSAHPVPPRRVPAPSIALRAVAGVTAVVAAEAPRKPDDSLTTWGARRRKIAASI